MRVLLWHGWLLEGTGANIYAARVAEVWRRTGHEVLLLCQQRHVDHLGFVDASGTVGEGGVSEIVPSTASDGAGTVTVLRPDIGTLLPVFVYDEYEGFRVKTFLDLEEEELRTYLDRSVAGLRAAVAWRPPEAVVTGHAMAGPPVARRALGEGTYAAKVHGSDIEYAAREQERYRKLAREGLEGARWVAGGSRDVLARAEAVAPAIAGRTMVIPPGVDVKTWRPRRRPEALKEAASALELDPARTRGRPSDVDGGVAEALRSRDPQGLDALARGYDQSVPDPDAPARLQALAGHAGSVVGYLGKLISQKGTERYLEAMALLGPDVRGLVVGFGTFREWLAALLLTFHGGDPDAHAWLAEASPMRLELSPEEVRAAAGLAGRMTFTGRLDHRYAPQAVAAMDVLVVPSTLSEAFGMVAAEGAAAGALPLVARHSSLAEVAEALEGAVGRPGLLSFEPGPGATRRVAEGIERLLSLPEDEARAVRERARRHVVSEWTWERTAARLLEAATGRPGGGLR
jgi:glycosyltransferase involved in cell wall biosynthesis